MTVSASAALWEFDGNYYEVYPEDYSKAVPIVDNILEAHPDYEYYSIRQNGPKFTLTLTTTKWVVNDSGDTMYWASDGSGIIYNAAWYTGTGEVSDWEFDRSFTYSQDGWNSGPTEMPFLYVNFDVYTKGGNFFKSYTPPFPTDGKIIYTWDGDIADTTDDITDTWYKIAEFRDASIAYAVYDGLLYTEFYYDDDGNWRIAHGSNGLDLIVTDDLLGIYARRSSDDLYVQLLMVQPAVEEPSVYRVTLPSSPVGYVVTKYGDSSQDVTEGGSFSFKVTILDGYEADSSFSVKANGVTLTAVDGVYTISNITANQQITVVGVVEIDDTDDTDDTDDGDNTGSGDCSCVDGIREIIEKQTEQILAGMNEQVLDFVLSISERFSIITDAISAQTEDILFQLDFDIGLLRSDIINGVADITEAIQLYSISNAGTIADSFENLLGAAVDDITLSLNGHTNTTTTAINNAASGIITAISNISGSSSADDEEIKTDSQPLMEQLKDVYKESDDDTTINISAEDIFGLKHITKLITSLIDTGADMGDLGAIVSNDNSYRWFTAEIAADIDSVGTATVSDDESTYDRLNREFNEIYFPERVGESA